MVAPKKSAAAWWLIAGGLSLGFLIDQHRLQPWAYQSVIYASVFATMRPAMARRILIPLAASVYIYSAAGKFDYQFVHSVGQEFLNVPLRWFGMADAIDEGTKATLAHGPPVVELAAGVMLLFDKTRRVGGMIVVALHASLLVFLGPWGLDHSHGVLLWNVLLTVQAWFLFLSPVKDDSRDNRLLYRQLFRLPFRRDSKLGLRQRLGRGVAQCLALGSLLVALIAPASERAGLWDHWTSWALYSPHSSRTQVEFHRSAIGKLPATASEHFQADEDGDGWQTLALDDWSLDSLAVPVYPQARYQLALARELADQGEIEKSAVRCKVRSIANRVTGRREEQLLLGLNEISEALNDYWLVPQ